MRSGVTAVVATCLLASNVDAHGHITIPPARNNGSVELAGNCENLACLWFSQITEIPGEPTLPDYARSFNVNVSSGEDDWSRKMPWRAPGTAPVYGSGCGAAGGGPKAYDNGGFPPDGYKQGEDFLNAPELPTKTVWKRGSVQEVAWATFANHGGGYSWRICKKGEGKYYNASEECFQNNVLTFSGDKQWIRYTPFWQWGELRTIPDYEIPAVRVDIKGRGQWTRNPVPGCYFCNQAECMRNYSKFDDQQHCSQACSGLNVTDRSCPPGTTQFPEALPGLSGYYTQKCIPGTGCDGLSGFNYNIVDLVNIPEDIDAGDYLLSWRWDCEQSAQIWQNCADISIE